MKHIIYTLFILFSFISCDDYENIETLRHHNVGPLAKATLDSKNVVQIYDNPEYEFEVFLPIPIPPNAQPVPAFNNLSSNRSTQELDGPFSRIGLDTLTITGTIRNTYPFTLSAGTRLVIRNEGSEEVLISTTIERDLAPNATTSFSESRVGGELKTKFECSIENASSLGTSQPVNILGGSTLEVTLRLNFKDIRYISMLPETVTPVELVAGFDLGLDEEITGVEGTANVRIQNSVPLDVDVQIYMTDENDIVIDSLFNAPVLIAKGSVANPLKSNTLVTHERILRNLIRVRNLELLVNFKTLGEDDEVLVTNESKIDFQVIGDLQLNVDLDD